MNSLEKDYEKLEKDYEQTCQWLKLVQERVGELEAQLAAAQATIGARDSTIAKYDTALTASEKSRLEMRRLLTLLRPQVAIWLAGTGELEEIDKVLADTPPTGYVKVEQYNELLYAVASKFPNETRHQTALRYIQEAESRTGTADESLKEGKA